VKQHLRIVHYINQFFAGIGGEEKAGIGLAEKDGTIGPGRLLAEAAAGQGSVVATLYCGDNYFVERQDEVLAQAIKLIASHKPDLVIAGPAFNAGRYGQACGALCSAVQRELRVPAITAMYPENPAADLYRKELYIIEASDRARDLSRVLARMVQLGAKLVREEEIGAPVCEGYIPRGIKRNRLVEKKGAERAVDMLLSKVRGGPFATELQALKFDTVPPAPPVKDLAQTVIAIVTDGGIVPIGNPDNIRAASGKTFGAYSIEGLKDVSAGIFESIHAGMDNKIATADPHRFVPVDVMRDLERERRIARLYERVYSASGCAVELGNAIRMGLEIARDLLRNGVTGVILTSA
jgi:glycine reductase complex component B subunit gamma